MNGLHSGNEAESQRMRSGKGQTLGAIACSLAHSVGIPVVRRQFTRIIGVFVCIEHIHDYLSVISQTVLGFIYTQEVILQLQFRVDGVCRIEFLAYLALAIGFTNPRWSSMRLWPSTSRNNAPKNYLAHLLQIWPS